MEVAMPEDYAKLPARYQPMKKDTKFNKPAGFTLVELLVVIAIIAVLATVAMAVAQRVIRTARASKDASNLRQCGVFLELRASDLGHYPLGLDPTTGKSWVDDIVSQETGGSSSITQMETFWSPLFEKKIPLDLEQPAVTHFGANPYILTEPDPNGTPGDNQPMWLVRTSQLQRPSEQIVLCGMPPQSAKIAYHMAHPIATGILGLAGGDTSTSGTVPQSDSEQKEQVLNLPPGLTESQQYNALPDFFRYYNGKGNFLFADGHLLSLRPSELKQKNWAISY